MTRRHAATPTASDDTSPPWLTLDHRVKSAAEAFAARPAKRLDAVRACIYQQSRLSFGGELAFALHSKGLSQRGAACP
jgi:hypothetical protein